MEKLKQDALNQDVKGLIEHLDSVEYNDPSFVPDINFAANGDILEIIGMPLPDNYPLDHEYVVFYIRNYPLSEVRGFYIPEGSPNMPLIEAAFKNHNFSAARLPYSDLCKINDWRWICFHKGQDKWRYNDRDHRAGDNLVKFYLTVLSVIWGEYHV
jgi:hypothetical protein